jgi:uncharacterized protein YjbJ (UPF0337 family)
MNWNEVEGKWNQLKGSVREKYGKLTDDDLQVIGGKKDRFIGLLQERYGMQREQAEKDANTWLTNARASETPRTHTSGGSGQY